MKTRFSVALVLLVFVSNPAFAHESRPLILEHANVINPVDDVPLLDQTIVLQAGKIQNISSTPATMPGERMDLRGAWVLPGLIDAHVHVTNIAAARRMLSCGITTGRSMFAWNYADVGLRTLHERGDVDIPNILAAGYPVLANLVRFKPDMTAIVLDHPLLDDLRSLDRIGPDGARRIVRANADRHVDWIKVFANERAGILETDPSTRNLNDEELRAAVEEATRLGLPVAAHAYSDEGVAAAVNAGVRTIEHGSLITEPTLELMRERGTYFVPTLYGFSVALTSDSPPEERALQPRIEMLLKGSLQAIAMARRLGVPVVAGTDTGYEDKEPLVIDEIIQLASAGLSNLEAIRSATSLSAECLKISSAKGALKPGFDADLVAYKDNPLKDLAVLREPILVINGGKVFLYKSPL
ncbi:MAG: amidohydrolase family protein [Candidatus Aminicenantes bacterium]|nr:amidohydrolase family protein [Candidatus Aminicenantes bacterium]